MTLFNGRKFLKKVKFTHNEQGILQMIII